MAVLDFYLYDLNDNQFYVENVVSCELSRDEDAACDGLRLNLQRSKMLDEINRVEVYREGKMIFNGYCDTQRESMSASGYQTFLYARSSACILTDNEAKPFTYNYPSALSLFSQNARPFGFTCNLPKLYSDSPYRVGSSTSCFAAINNFVSALTGKNIIVSCDNCITVADDEKEIDLNAYEILSEKRIINRGGVISSLEYKNDFKSDYSYHLKSRFFEEKDISNSKKINLSNLPEWQKNVTLLNLLKTSAKSYKTIEIEINGCFDFSLYTHVNYSSNYLGNLDDYYISSVKLCFSQSGGRTKIKLCKKIDLMEINYVVK